MSRSSAEIVREYGPFPGAVSVHGVTHDGRHVWFASGDRLNAFDPASGKALRTIEVAADAGRLSTGAICSSSPRIASRRSTRRPGECSPRFLRPAAAVIPGSRGPKARSGWGSTETGRSIRSTPRPVRSCARLSPTASSPASPGSTASCGTAPGRVTRASCGGSTLEAVRSWRSSRCRPESAFRGWNPMGVTFSTAEGEAAAR